VESDDPLLAQRLVRRVFGVTSASVALEIPTDVPSICSSAVQLGDPHLQPGGRFAIRARRTGQHAFTSQELAAEVGGAVLGEWPERGLKVDLSNPELEIFVEVRGPRTYVYLDRTPGPGGLPLGVAGKVVALVDGTRGALGAFLMMKRGCRSSIVSFGAGEELTQKVLSQFDPALEVRTVRGDPSAAYDALQEAAEARNADGVVLPLSVEEYGEARAQWGDRVVFSPTVGLTDEEVQERWEKVETLLT
jgi:thiamine biosynthesis protein ThiI